MFGRSLRPEAPLEGALDIDAVVARIPPSYTVKGMFCARFANVLGHDFERLQHHLDAPPRGGRYVAFKDYPQTDYTRLVAAAAARQFPELGVREAIRRVARDDIATFSASTFGKILFTLIGDAHASLLRVPDAYQQIVHGFRVSAEDLDARTTRLTFDRYRGSTEYILGQLEGIVLSFNRLPLVTVNRPSVDRLCFEVCHGG